ncbi:hypothetical protein SDC9_105496 [bioreactor metagenome]|uniref:Uncharacterized protein n=1 Tax=bioreactor metagenome TaxID=1076179 RepID=A0A645B693_9ZZZZ
MQHAEAFHNPITAQKYAFPFIFTAFICNDGHLCHHGRLPFRQQHAADCGSRPTICGFFQLLPDDLIVRPFRHFLFVHKVIRRRDVGVMGLLSDESFQSDFSVFPAVPIALSGDYLDPSEGFRVRIDLCPFVGFPFRRQRLVGSVLRLELCFDGLCHRQSIECDVAGRTRFPASDHFGIGKNAFG